MHWFYLRNAWRALLKNPFYHLIHVLGLGTGMATCLFIYFYVQFHLSYDQYHQNAPHTYRVVYDLLIEKTEHAGEASYAIYDALRSKVAGIDQAAFSMIGRDFTLNVNGQLFSTDKKAAFTSSEWFRLFDYHWLAGDPKDLDQPNTVVLMASTAKRYFGDTDVIGKELLVETKYPLKIVGIIDDQPANTSLRSDLYISTTSIKTLIPDIQENYFSFWGYLSSENQVYISVAHSDQVPVIEQTLQRLTNEYFGAESGKLFRFKLQPLEEVHFDASYGGTANRSLLLILSMIGIGILLIALLNYVNLSMVHYARKSPEIGTRKVLGSSRFQLFLSILCESTLLVGLSVIISLLLLRIAIPLANHFLFFQEPVALPSWSSLLRASGVAWFLLTLLASLYPAYLIGRISILSALKKHFPLGSQTGRKSIVLIQSILSQGLILATLVMIIQVHYLRSTDLGFDRTSILLLSLPRNVQGHEQAIKNLLQSHPAVCSYSFCLQAPALHDGRGGTFFFDNKEQQEAWPARATFADSAYLSTLEIPLLAGRNIRENNAIPEYLINEKMAHLLGYRTLADILGKSLLGAGMYDEKPGVIVGVVANYNTKSLHDPIEPTVIGYDRNLFQTLAIKVNHPQASPFLLDLEKSWKASYPQELFRYHWLADQIHQLYREDEAQERLILTAAALAIFISCLGLGGLLSITLVQRTKEIGIRKVLGASVSNLVGLLSKEFLKLMIGALFLASPIALWGTHRWLDSFAYHIEVQWWMFALTGVLSLTVAGIAIGFQVSKAAMANPVDSLRDE